MLTSAQTLLVNMWLFYGNGIISFIFWGLIGIAVSAPILMVYSIYQVRKYSGYYQIQESHHIKRAQNKREILVYGSLTASVALFIVVMFVA